MFLSYPRLLKFEDRILLLFVRFECYLRSFSSTEAIVRVLTRPVPPQSQLQYYAIPRYSMSIYYPDLFLHSVFAG